MGGAPTGVMGNAPPGSTGRSGRARHAAHLTVVHRPDDTRIYHRECRSLAAAGYRVSLVAPGAPPELADGVQGVAIPGFARRLARVRRALVGHPSLLVTAARLRADLYHVHDPELLLIAYLLKRLRGARAVYDVHEDYRVRLRAREWLPAGVRGLVAGAAGRWEARLAPRMDGIVAVSEAIARRFPGQPVAVVRNYPLTPVRMGVVPAPEERDAALVLCTGGVTNFGGVVEVARALGLVVTPDVRLAVLGGHRDRGAVQALDASAPPGRVELIGQVPLPDVYRWMARATIGAVCNQPLHGYEHAEPTKLFEYMAAGLPVIASDSPPWSDVVVESGCGVVVDPTDPAAIAAAIDGLMRDPQRRQAMGERGREAVAARFTWESQAAALQGLYGRLLGW